MGVLNIYKDTLRKATVDRQGGIKFQTYFRHLAYFIIAHLSTVEINPIQGALSYLLTTMSH